MPAHLQRLHHGRQRKPALYMEVAQVVLAECVGAGGGGCRVTQGQIRIFELPVHQGFHQRAVHRLVFMGAQAGKPGCRADLRRSQALAATQAGHKRITHGNTFQRFAHNAFPRARRRRFELQVEGEPAAKSRVNLLDAVGHPDGGNRVALQYLVDPRLTAHAGTGRYRMGIGTRHIVRGLRA